MVSSGVTCVFFSVVFVFIFKNKFSVVHGAVGVLVYTMYTDISKNLKLLTNLNR